MSKTNTVAPSAPVESPEMIALKAQIEALKADKAKLEAAISQPKRITLKVSEKGALSVYGMGRFPVTLYAEQWETLLSAEVSGQINAFIAANKGKGLTSKADKVLAEANKVEAERAARVASYQTGGTAHKVG